MVTIKFQGIRVCSKKNNRRNFGHVSLPSKAYEKFHDIVSMDLIPYSWSITKPFRMHVDYTIKGKYHQDLDNAVTSLLDVMKDWHVIPDDDLCHEISATKCNGKDWLVVIQLEEIEDL